MDKLKAKLQSLSQDRRYMVFVGLAIILNGMIGLVSPGFAAFLAIIIGPFCLLVGYYGGDVKKGLEEFKKDVEEAKAGLGDKEKITEAKAKEFEEKVEAAGEKLGDFVENAAKKAEEGAKKAATTAKKAVVKKAPAKKVAVKK